MVPEVADANSTALRAVVAASCAFLAISWMLATRSSIEPATIRVLPLTCSAAADTRLAWAVVCSAAALICWLTLVSSSEELASACVLSTMPPTSAACRFDSRVSRRAIMVETPSTAAEVSPNTVMPSWKSREIGLKTSAVSISEISAQRTSSRPPVASRWIVIGRHDTSDGTPR